MKVFSGHDRTLTSLQRDFGIYCVNLFSVIQAARVLSLPTHCIRKLILKYCNLRVKRLPSTCDWRYRFWIWIMRSVRPLDARFIADCRSVCHQLIYVSECMRCELIEMSPPALNLVCTEGPSECVGVRCACPGEWGILTLLWETHLFLPDWSQLASQIRLASEPAGEDTVLGSHILARYCLQTVFLEWSV